MRSEPVQHFLCGDLRIVIVVVTHFGAHVHVVDRADGQQVKLADRKTDLSVRTAKGMLEIGLATPNFGALS